MLVILGILVVLVVAVGAMVVTMSRALAPLTTMTIEAVDLTQVSDGQYEGQYGTVPVSATVQVTVAGHRITDIRILRHLNGRGKPGEAVAGRVIDAQSLSVDTVAGATYSSKVILKATELALRKGIK